MRRISVGTWPRKSHDPRWQLRKMRRGIFERIYKLPKRGTHERRASKLHQPRWGRVPSGRGDAKKRTSVEATCLLPTSLAHKERRKSRCDGQMRWEGKKRFLTILILYRREDSQNIWNIFLYKWVFIKECANNSHNYFVK